MRAGTPAHPKYTPHAKAVAGAGAGDVRTASTHRTPGPGREVAGEEDRMGGFFGVASTADCVADVFYGTDYHSHLGTRRGGMVTTSQGGLQAKHPRHLQLAFPDQVRGRATQARREPRPRRHQRLRGPAAADPVSPRRLRAGHGRAGQQPRPDRPRCARPARHAPQREQGQRGQSDRGDRDADQPGGDARRGHPRSPAHDPGLVLAPPADG